MVDDDITLLLIVREALTSCFVCRSGHFSNPDYAFELAPKTLRPVSLRFSNP